MVIVRRAIGLFAILGEVWNKLLEIDEIDIWIDYFSGFVNVMETSDD